MNINYTENPNKYKVRFKYENKITNLLLGYNTDFKFQFINLDTGRILNLVFETVPEAERWLNKTAKVIENE